MTQEKTQIKPPSPPVSHRKVDLNIRESHNRDSQSHGSNSHEAQNRESHNRDLSSLMTTRIDGHDDLTAGLSGQPAGSSDITFSGQSDFSHSISHAPIMPGTLHDHMQNPFAMSSQNPSHHHSSHLPAPNHVPLHHLPSHAMGVPLVPGNIPFNIPPPEVPPLDRTIGGNPNVNYPPHDTVSHSFQPKEEYVDPAYKYGNQSFHNQTQDRGHQRLNSERDGSWKDNYDHSDRSWHETHNYEDQHQENRHHEREDRHRSRKHRHKDRHRPDRDHRGPDRQRDRDYEGEEKFECPPSVTPPVPSISSAPQPPKPQTPQPEETRLESLESRIQFLLQQNRTDTETDADDSAANNSQEESAPPLPPINLPPLPEEEPPPPPLPPEPEEVPPPIPSANGIPGIKTSAFAAMSLYGYPQTDGMVIIDNHLPNHPLPFPVVSAASNQEDDRMSLASLSSGEEKLQIAAPFSSHSSIINHSELQVQAHPSISHLSHRLHNNYLNNLTNDYGIHHPEAYNTAQNSNCFPQELIMTAMDEKQEKMFFSVVDKVVGELKVTMRRDLRKRMVENSAFKTYENWWEHQADMDKVLIQILFNKVYLHRTH